MIMDLIPIHKFIMVNKLQEVTNPIIFDRGNVPTSDGLLSYEIFGTNTSERKTTFAYLSLNTPLFHPVVYKSLLRMEKRIEYIIQGSKNYDIDKDGQLVEVEEGGNTGITWLYKNWEKIKWKRNDSRMRNERIDMLESLDKDVIFPKQFIVIPAFYRDVDMSMGGDKPKVHITTQMYSELIRYASIVAQSNTFDFMINTTKYQMQMKLVDIYNELKSKIEKKNGLIKKSLLGKSVDYGVRTIISSPTIDNNRPEDMTTDAMHTGIPLFMVCSMLTPFIVHWVNNFFRREFEGTAAKYPIMTHKGLQYVALDNPTTYFNEEYVRKAIDRFIHSPYSRFDKIELPIMKEFKPKHPVYLRFKGHDDPSKGESSSIIDRPMTWTDILYMAAVEMSEDKYVYTTRYPISSITSGSYVSKIHVLSTIQTRPAFINDRVYKHYPVIDLDLPPEKIPTQFRDTTTICNVYLQQMGADYDGDQVTLKIPFTQEANAEAREKMLSKTQVLSSFGKNFRTTTNEMIQTLYMLTKDE